jgi:hypothetical protein
MYKKLTNRWWEGNEEIGGRLWGKVVTRGAGKSAHIWFKNGSQKKYKSYFSLPLDICLLITYRVKISVRLIKSFLLKSSVVIKLIKKKKLQLCNLSCSSGFAIYMHFFFSLFTIKQLVRWPASRLKAMSACKKRWTKACRQEITPMLNFSS